MVKCVFRNKRERSKEEKKALSVYIEEKKKKKGSRKTLYLNISFHRYSSSFFLSVVLIMNGTETPTGINKPKLLHPYELHRAIKVRINVYVVFSPKDIADEKDFMDI